MLHRLLRHRQTEQARADNDEIGIVNGFRHARIPFHKANISIIMFDFREIIL